MSIMRFINKSADPDDITIRDLDCKEIALLLRYRQLSDEDKETYNQLMDDLKSDNANNN